MPAPRTSPAPGLCLIPEGEGIFPNLTVRENLRMMTYTGASLTTIEEEAYGRFPRLAERRTQTAGTLSGGEQQMLAMARGLATNPAIAPARRAVDGARARSSSRSCTRSWPRSRATVCRSSSSSSSRAPCSGVADLAAILVHGKVARVGPPHELQDELSKAYLGG